MPQKGQKRGRQTPRRREARTWANRLTSKNGAYTLTLQDDGNLVLYAGGEAVWSTGTNGQNVVRAEVQKDGNFVLYTPDKPVWHSRPRAPRMFG